MTKALCSKDLEYFSHYLSTYDAFESSDGANVINRNVIGNECLSKWKLSIHYPSENDELTYYAFDYPDSFYGRSPEMWFSAEGNAGSLSFRKSLEYFIDPVVEYGHCDKIQVP